MTAAARDAVVHGLALWANPSSPHAEGRAARAALEAARREIAAAHGWRGEVLLTSGASESLGIALGRTTLPRRLITAVEHDAVMRAGTGAAVVPVGADGIVDREALAAMLADGPALVCVQWANSETGVAPADRGDRRCGARGGRHAAGRCGADARVGRTGGRRRHGRALSAHKRGGPPGVGALLVRDLRLLHPSGGQERGYRPGTENLPGRARLCRGAGRTGAGP